MKVDMIYIISVPFHILTLKTNYEIARLHLLSKSFQDTNSNLFYGKDKLDNFGRCYFFSKHEKRKICF